MTKAIYCDIGIESTNVLLRLRKDMTITAPTIFSVKTDICSMVAPLVNNSTDATADLARNIAMIGNEEGLVTTIRFNDVTEYHPTSLTLTYADIQYIAAKNPQYKMATVEIAELPSQK